MYKTRFLEVHNGAMRDLAVQPIFDHVRTLLPQVADPSRYMPLPDGNQLIMEVVSTPTAGITGSIRGRFGSKRMTGLPRIERAGAYSDLQLAADAGLAELRHFVVIPDRQLLGLELNGNAPGPSRWAGYLMFKVPRVDLITTDMILAGTTDETLHRLGRVVDASMTVYAEQVESVGELDSGLRSGLRALKRTSPNARRLTVSFELGTRKRSESLELRWRRKIAGFLGSTEGRQSLQDFTVRAFDHRAGRTRDVDLLEDRFVGFKKVASLDSGGRVIDSDSMFAAIDEVLNELPSGF